MNASNERDRMKAERGRVEAEEDRVEAEGQQVRNEPDRRVAEAGRVTAEEDRGDAEGYRDDAEEAREVAEGEREVTRETAKRTRRLDLVVIFAFIMFLVAWGWFVLGRAEDLAVKNCEDLNAVKVRVLEQGVPAAPALRPVDCEDHL